MSMHGGGMNAGRSSSPIARGPMGRGGPMGMMGAKAEKPRDFKGTMLKLIKYLSSYKGKILVVFVFAIASTVAAIVGHKILGNATTKLFEGVLGQISGTGTGIDFPYIENIIIMTLLLYVALWGGLNGSI